MAYYVNVNVDVKNMNLINWHLKINMLKIINNSLQLIKVV